MLAELIERHRSLQRTVNELDDETDDVLFPLCEKLADLANRIIDHRPATLEEARAKARYLLELVNRGEDPLGEDEWRQFGESIAA